MSQYTKSTNFATKDNLTPGDPLKIVRGTEIDTEYNNIATAIATKTDNASAAITGGSITGITDLAVADGGTGASTAAGGLNNLLPTQTGNANKYLQTDGTNATWDAVSLSTADITGTLPVANGGTGVTSSTGTGSVVLSNSPTLVTPALGTPASGVATNLTGLPISTGVSGLGTGVATFLGTPSSANLASAVTDETGSGALVFANSPTLVTPALGTPSALVGTNITGTASGLTAGNVTTNANLTGAVTSVGNATSLGSFSSANLLGALTDETGTGSAVFATSPTLVTPILGTPTSATLTNATGLPIATGVSGLGTGVATALAVNVGSSGAPLVNGGVLGTPSSGTVTNLTGTASININGTVGATTATTGAFTSLTASTTLGVTGVSTLTGGAVVQGLTVGRGAGAVSTNTAVGASALTANTTGDFNTAIGYAALNASTALVGVAGNTAIGGLALTTNTSGESNTGVGFSALRFTTTGSSNSSLGRNALRENTTGSFSVAIGGDALYNNTTASNNTAVGYQAGYANTTGTQNTFLGYQAGLAVTTSNGQTFIGQGAGAAKTTGGNNTFVGTSAGGSATTGTGNTFIGVNDATNGSGFAVTTGSKNTIIGGYTGNQGGLDIRTSSNYIVLSDGDGNPRIYVDSNGKYTQTANFTDNYAAIISNSTATRPYGLYVNFSGATPNNTTEQFIACEDTTNMKCIIYSSGTVTNRTGTYNAFSDIKLKQDVVDAGSQWDDIKAVRVRKFRLKDDVVANPEAKPLIGVIAQELELTSAGLIDDCVDKEGDVTKSVKYSILYMKAIKALQEAMERIEQLEARLDAANL